MRIFAGDRVRAIMDRLKMPEGEAIEAGIVNRSIESAQRKVEARNFDIRKQLLEYDDVSQRPAQGHLPAAQRDPGADRRWTSQVANLRRAAMTDVVRTFVPAESVEEQWDLDALEKALRRNGSSRCRCGRGREERRDHRRGHRRQGVQAADQAFQAKVSRWASSSSPLHAHGAAAVDRQHWREHLAALDYLRQGIHLRGYAQKNPKQEYKREAFELFSQLLDVVKMEVTRILMTVRIQSQEEVEQAAEAIEERAEHFSNVTYTHPNEDGSVASRRPTPPAQAAQVPRVGRNDPCPCGSGKKYKHCHGRRDPPPLRLTPHPLKGAPPADRQSRIRGGCWRRAQVPPNPRCFFGRNRDAREPRRSES
jgi:preprotein translocase subunit SecA